MKMSFLALAVVTAFAFTSDDALTSLNVDTARSTIHWVGKKVTGKHTGVIQLMEANLEMKKGVLIGGSFVIDMNTIAVTDLKGGMNDKLTGHLKSDDFFGVDTYPKASFSITEVVASGDGIYDVTGDLTIKAHTHPVSFSTVVSENDASVTATAKIIVDRTKYDVRYGSGKFFENLGDKAIYDDFELNVSLVAAK